MPRCWPILLLLLFGFACTSRNEYKESLIERFYKADLIDKSERDAWQVWEDRNKGRDRGMQDDTEEQSMPHYRLRTLLSAKMFSTLGTAYPFLWDFHPAPIVVPTGKEKEVVERLTEYTKKLLKEKLISEKTSTEIINKINTLSLRSEYELIADATRRTEKEYFLAPERFKGFADDLLERQLINKKEYDELMARSAKGELRSYDEPLAYIDNMIWIDFAEYSGAPEANLEKIYRKLAAGYPELAFDKFSYVITKNEEISDTGFVQKDITVTLERQGKKYSHTSFWAAEYKSKDTAHISELPEEFHQVFNKMLADQQLPYRLHTVNTLAINTYFIKEPDRLGLLPLTKKQFDGLQWMHDGQSMAYMNISYENFAGKITQKTLNEAIALYDSIGLFSHLLKSEKDQGIREVAAREINHFSDILATFKNLVFEIDLEYGVANKQYERLTRMLAAISKGAFRPTAIIDNYHYNNNKTFDYGFMLNGKPYKTKLTQEDDWIDPEFFEFIQSAMGEQDKKGKFYELYPTDGARFIYLTHEQAEILSKRKMIELSEEDVAD